MIMDYYFSQFMQLWVLPPGLNLILILLGLFLLRFKIMFAKSLIWASALSLWILSTPLIAQYLADGLQNQYPPLMNSSLNTNQAAIVVLDAGSNLRAPEYGTPVVAASTLQRLRYAAYLHQQTNIPILVSGYFPMTPNFNEAENMAKSLEDYFNIKARWKEDQGATTAQEAIYTAKILLKENIKRIYLVTEAIHIPRSMYVFQGRGLEVIAAPTGYISLSHNLGRFSALMPNMQALRISTATLHEYIGLIWYSSKLISQLRKQK